MTDIIDKNLTYGNIRARTSGETPHIPEEPAPEYLVSDHYLAFYRTLRPEPEQDTVLASARCIIGSEIRIILEGSPHLETIQDEFIVALPLEDADALRQRAERGWEIECFIDYVVYSKPEKSLRAEFAFFAYDPALPALEAFVAGIHGRLIHGEHPDIALPQRTFQRVLESRRTWYLTKETPYPELQPGDAVWKRKRGLADTLVNKANHNAIGCEVAAVIFWIVVLGLIVWLVFLR